MRLTIPVKELTDILPPKRELAQAAGRGVSAIVKRHLVNRDGRGRSDGLPRTGYYGDAAGSVTTETAGDIAVISIPKEGMALHYYGGVVYPTNGHKALAIPKSAITAGKPPAEFDPDRSKLALVWPKGENTGTLKDKETDEVVYLLVSKATIPADATVLPPESDMVGAASAEMEKAMEILTP